MRFLKDVPDSWLWKYHRIPRNLDMIDEGYNFTSFYLWEFIIRRIPNLVNLIKR